MVQEVLTQVDDVIYMKDIDEKVKPCTLDNLMQS